MGEKLNLQDTLHDDDNLDTAIFEQTPKLHELGEMFTNCVIYDKIKNAKRLYEKIDNTCVTFREELV